MTRMIAATVAALLLASPAAWSIGTRSSAAVDPTYNAAAQLIGEQRYAEAVPLLKQVLARDPGRADAYNELGFASRKLGDRVAALAYYKTALELDPRHLGATEYLGELYAESGDLPHAEAQLARVAVLCHGPCEAYTDLQAAIQRQRATGVAG